MLFPAVSGPEGFSLASPCNPRNFSKEFARRAELPGCGSTGFHDLRGIHATGLLDADIPVHTLAQRIGDDPAVLLWNYAKRKRPDEADKKLSLAISTLTAVSANVMGMNGPV